MYEELIKRLREASEYVPCIIDREDTIKAADTIEELSKYINTIKRLKCEGWYLQQTKFHDGYHAVGTMPLPEPPEEE